MKNFAKEMKPFFVLVSIAIVVSLLLGITNYFTAPIIEKTAAEAEAAARKSVLPDADSFEMIDSKPEWNVNSVYRSDAGYVVSATRKGYGQVTVMTGIDNDGKVVGVSIDASGETTGVGSKVTLENFWGQFIGLKGSAESVDLITNATYSSTAVRECVSAALAVYADLSGGAE